MISRDQEGISVLDVAKSSLKEAEEMDLMQSRMEKDTRARYLDWKTSREKFYKDHRSL